MLTPGPHPWESAVAACQAEIASLEPHPHYLNAYRQEETTYWSHIPKWLYEDWQGKTADAFLDIGCAYGTLALYAKRLLECEGYLIDWTDRATSPLLLTRHSLRFAVSNIELDPFPWDRQFDLILFTEVLEHLNFHPRPTLQKIRSLLTPAGRLYMSTPDAEQWGQTHYYSSYREMPYPTPEQPLVDDHLCLFTADDLMELAAETGLQILRMDHSPGVGHRHLNLTLAPT